MTTSHLDDSFTLASELEDACHRDGLPITAQRRVVLEVLAERSDHPTADQLHAEVLTRLPGVSRTTVYRVLDTLVHLGMAAKCCHIGSVARYDARTDRHHHLVCTECGRVSDVEATALNGLRYPSVRREGFEIHDYSVLFRGLCAECRGDARLAGMPLPLRSQHQRKPDRRPHA